MMVRNLKFHEKKLLKKVDFINWHIENMNEVKALKKYCIKKREDYSKYKSLARIIRMLAEKVKGLPVGELRSNLSGQLLRKLYTVGVINTWRDFSSVCRVNALSFCERRLPVMMVRTTMVPSVNMATKFIEQGHVRVGPEIVKDPAYIVTRNKEDYITWVDYSKVRRHMLVYNGRQDDFELSD